MKRIFSPAMAMVLLVMGCGPKGPPADPVRAMVLLTGDSPAVPFPNRVRIYSSLKEGRREFFADGAPKEKWLKLETTNEVAIRSLVTAMREKAEETIQGPAKDGIRYHIYLHAPDSKFPLYYVFIKPTETNEPSCLTAHSTSGNLCNAEGVERWFAANGLLPRPQTD